LLELPPGALGDFFKKKFRLLSGLGDFFHGPSLPGALGNFLGCLEFFFPVLEAQVKFPDMWRLRRGSTIFSGGKLLVKDSK
jgi:hypothetical protein